MTEIFQHRTNRFKKVQQFATCKFRLMSDEMILKSMFMLIVMVDNEVYGEVIIDPLLQVCSMSNDPKTGNRTKVLYLQPLPRHRNHHFIFILVISTFIFYCYSK